MACFTIYLMSLGVVWQIFYYEYCAFPVSFTLWCGYCKWDLLHYRSSSLVFAAQTVPDSRATKHLGTAKFPAWPSSWPQLCPANPRTQQEEASLGGYSCMQEHRGVLAAYFKAVVLTDWGQREFGEDYGLYLRKMPKCCQYFLRIHGPQTHPRTVINILH